MKRVASGVVRGLLSLSVALLVCAAVFVGVARELVYQVDDFQAELVGFINERTDFALELESITGSWSGLAPRFSLRGVALRLAQSETPPLHIDKLDLEILLLRSLVNLEPRLRLRVAGANGHAWYQDNHLVLSGFDGLTQSDASEADSTEQGESDQTLLDLILAQPRIEFSDSAIRIEGLYPEPVLLGVHRFRTEAGKRRRYLLGEFTADGPSKIRFELKGKVSGSVFQQGSLSGGLYAQVDNADWLPWVPAAKRGIASASLANLNGGGRFWLNISKGEIKEILSDVQFSNIELETSNEIKPPHILNLQGKARWLGQTADDWRLDLQDIRMQTSRFLWMPNYMNLESKPGENGLTRYRVRVDDMDIEPWVNYYLGIQSRDSELHKTLKKLRPAGQLQDVAVELMVAEQQVKDYRFALTLNAFQNRPWKKFPGLYDLDIRAWGKKGLTLFEVQESYLELNYPQLFRDVITINHADASLVLRDLDDEWQLQSGPMHVNSRHAQSATQMSLSIPKDEAQPPFLQLQATLRNADGKHKSLYLPAGVIPDALLKWLDDAIIDGHLVRGDILVHGPVRKERDEPLGVLLGFTAEQGVLQFLPDWKEPVRDAVADVVVDRGVVDAHIIAGHYYGQAVEHASVMLPKYQAGEPHVLSVKAATHGAADQGLAILTSSPLRQKIGDFIDDVSLQGDMAVDFALDIPLQSEFAAQARSTTQVAMQNGVVGLPAQDIEITDVAALVQYDLKKGLSADKIKGRFLGGDVSGAITTGSGIQLAFSGNSTVQAINEWRPLFVFDVMSGPLQYKTTVDIPLNKDDGTPLLSITSQLKDTVINLPPPFGKSAGEGRQVTLVMQLGQKPLPLSVRYADLGNLSLVLGEEGIVRGALHLGAGNAILPAQDILKVSGELSHFNDREWLALLPTPSTTATTDQAIVGDQHNDSKWYSRLDDSELRVGELTLMGYALGQTDLRLARGQQQWLLWLNNATASGRLELPDYILGPVTAYHQKTQPLVVDLKRLQVAPATASAETSAETSVEPYSVWQPADVSPLLIPPLDVRIDDFSVGEAQLGQWRFMARPVQSGLQISELLAKVDGVTLSGSAMWSEDQNKERKTRFEGKLVAGNAADAIAAMGGTPTISSKSANAKGSVTWPGAPFEFAVPRLTGDLSLKLKDGVFYNVSSNAAGKLWGALNFETLMRRLQLDFDDLSESEMVYDELSGNINLDKGILNLKQIKLNSPAIKMYAEGKVDIEHDALDLGLDVTLPVTRNLVLPAAVIGGVPAAATAYVVEKMFGEQFDKLTTIKYQIKGTFEQPQVAVKDSFSIIPKQVGEAVMRNDKDAARQPNPQPTPNSMPEAQQESTP